MNDERQFIRTMVELRMILAGATLHTLLRKANFNPDQPRIPAGEHGGGRWTDGEDDSYTGPLLHPISGKPETERIDLRQEERRGGHAIRHHVAKSDFELLDRLGPPASRWLPISRAMIRNGTFFSIQEANRYVNEVLNENIDKVIAVAQGTEPEYFLIRRYGYVTGREAYRAGPYEEPVMRRTYAVGVHIVHDPTRQTGFRINTAYPLNEDLFLEMKDRPLSQAFIRFSRGLISDYDLFENDEARISLGLNCLVDDKRRAEESLQTFIDFVEDLERRNLSEAELEAIWARSHVGFYIAGPGEIMRFLRLAATLAQKKMRSAPFSPSLTDDLS